MEGNNTGTDSTAQADAGGSPNLSSIISGLGGTAAQGAIDQVSGALPDLSSQAGSSFAQGALDTLSPYLPAALVVAAIALLLIRR